MKTKSIYPLVHCKQMRILQNFAVSIAAALTFGSAAASDACRAAISLHDKAAQRYSEILNKSAQASFSEAKALQNTLGAHSKQQAEKATAAAKANRAIKARTLPECKEFGRTARVVTTECRDYSESLDKYYVETFKYASLVTDGYCQLKFDCSSTEQRAKSTEFDQRCDGRERLSN